MRFRAGILRDVTTQAMYALRENRMRTALSIIGVMVGVAAVMIVGTVTQGVRHYVFTELESYGLRTIWVYRNWEDANPLRTAREGSGIDNDDLRVMQSGCCPAVRRYTPVVWKYNGRVVAQAAARYGHVNLEGVGVEYLAINNDVVASGRGFRIQDIERRQAVAMIGTKVARELFGPDTNPIGASLRIGEQRVSIIGVLADKHRDLLTRIGAESYEANERVLIPYTLHQQMNGDKDVQTLQAEAVTLAQSDEAINQILEVLKRHHRDRYRYHTDTMQGWVDTANGVLSTITLVGLLGAAMALLVGGIGIMNIMGTTVVERTREIGIRKAIGARDQDILVQFLLEAAAVSVLGGVCGLLLGAAVAVAGGFWLGYVLVPSWIAAVVGIGVAVLVGLASGYYPARRAAQLRPVEALRYD